MTQKKLDRGQSFCLRGPVKYGRRGANITRNLKHNYVEDPEEIIKALRESQGLLKNICSPHHPGLSRELTIIILRLAHIKARLRIKGNSHENAIL